MSTTSLRELGSELIAALLRVLDRVAGGFASACKLLGIAVPIGAATGSCHDAAPVPAPVVQTAPVAMASELADVDTGPAELGSFRVTFYYVIGEAEADMIAARHEAQHAADTAGDVLAAAGMETEPAEKQRVTLYDDKTCGVISEVSAEFASALSMEGTGKLRDGRVVHVAGRCKCAEATRCFRTTGKEWGNAGTGRPLDPFRTVAVDPRMVKLGSLLYIPALDGMTMPGRSPVGGFVHDGCVAADDTGGGIDGRQLDLFVAKRSYYLGLARRRGSHAWAKHVKVMDGSSLCARKGGRVYRVGESLAI